MSNAISRRVRRARGLPAVEVSSLIVARENMFWIDDVRDYRSNADVLMLDADVPLADMLDRTVLMGEDSFALDHFDTYLQAVHLGFADKTDDTSLRLLRNLVGYGGSFVGECLLLEVPDAVWITPEVAERDHADMIASLHGMDGQLTGIIHDPVSTQFAFPFAKVFKFLMNGMEDSTRTFVRVMSDQMVPQ